MCADDYGLTPAVSAGIRRAFAAGRLSFVSAMANRPDWRRAARELRDMGVGGEAVGLHLNLTLGQPLGAMRAFAPSGELPDVKSLIGGVLAGRLPLDEIRVEAARQIDCFAAEFGAPPAFLDGHQHVHALPGVRAVLLQELELRGLAGHLWLRDPADRLTRIARRGCVAKAAFVALLAHGFGDAARSRGFATNEGFSGFTHFDAQADCQSDFRGALAAAGARHLVMRHPGEVDDELARIDRAVGSRLSELRFLLSEDFTKVLKKMGKSLASAAEFTIG